MEVDRLFRAEPLEALAVRATSERFAVEREIIRVLLADPLTGIRTLKTSGINFELFTDDSCRLVFLVCEHFGPRGRDAAVGAAVTILRMERLAGLRWGGVDFAAFARSFYDSPTPIQSHVLIELARRLVAVASRLRDAADYARHAQRLLTPTLKFGKWDYANE